MSTLDPNIWCKVQIVNSPEISYNWRESAVLIKRTLFPRVNQKIYELVYRDFGYWSDDYWIINLVTKSNVRSFDNFGTAFNIHINNLNANIRKHLKRMKKQMDDFKATKFLCDGCIHRNKYLLTKKCCEEFESIPAL